MIYHIWAYVGQEFIVKVVIKHRYKIYKTKSTKNTLFIIFVAGHDLHLAFVHLPYRDDYKSYV